MPRPTLLASTLAMTLLGGVLPLAVTASTPAAAAAPVVAEADSYVESNAPDRNLGSRTFLRTDASPLKRSYLRFQVPAPSPSTALRVFALSSQSHGFAVHAVADNSWGEDTITWDNAPPVGEVLGETGPVEAGNWYNVDVSAAMGGPGLYSFALTTAHTTSLKLASRESTNPPQLVVAAPPPPPPPSSSSYVVTQAGPQYVAVSPESGDTITGALKTVVETAAERLAPAGGTVRFGAGTFDLGSSYFKFYSAADLVFEGQGIDATIIRNHSDDASDTEPFNFSGADRVTIRDLTVVAGGLPRSTSDAIDFDQGNNSVVERVKVAGSRGRGIVFDGKNDSWTSLANQITDCVITGVETDGIEFLASSGNVVRGCTITDVGGHGIQLNKSSSLADQPNKKSSDNQLVGNRIDQAGQDGISINGGDNNQVVDNVVTNSSDDRSSKDGIRIGSSYGVSCNGTVVRGNTSSDTQATPTQRYGLHISSSLCEGTRVEAGNVFSGNVRGPVRDVGTGTVYA